ncbi:cell division protein FtsI (penicillin-binding protein 3) [Lutibacter sp. Hel_I_33_5]|uniref:penicillin-binding protein n=1 Tax=Lutibacter sp. Hel_I_33_5 TaxID=1566289 RepID=UPI0011A62391|nr:penicillin-binding protein [Lutibacter sp. Hel_I_33_5]TVZ56858.1 cell division protein FtsI (penicillin-binding protein 3) [Lutibacter sp. Hel_I_33_5]
MTLFLLAIIFRVFNLQYIQGEKYKRLSTERNIKQDTVYANKGNVYAADGNLLATSMSKYTIRMDAVAVKDKIFYANVLELSKELSKMFGKTTEHYEQRLRNAKKSRNRYLLIARNVGYNDYIKMKQFPIFRKGVYRGGFIAEHKTVRAHPIGKIAERTIGYHDFRGDAGLEGAYANHMKGENGVRWKQKIAKGQWKPINDVNEKEPIDGHDVITTIDVNIQDITHHALLQQLEHFEADHGCAVVMETKTGEIKAIANLGRTSDGKYFEKRNYAIWESHEPGSTFKLASLMAALDDKVIDTSTVVDTEKGRIYIHNRKVEDSQRGGYGKISAARVFEVSSNVGIVKLIKKHYDEKPEKFISKIKEYGFTKKIGLPIKGEGKPFVPTPKNKKRWNKISLEWMAWGYGVSVTPLQTLMFYNAVANDGVMVKPRFIKELRREDKVEKVYETEIVNARIASKETIKKIKTVMENVVVKGTADNIYSPNFSMAGKTGTAKKYIPRHKNNKGETISGHYSNKHYVASFAGFFPVENPKYSCIVVVHDPKKEKGYYGAIVAAPVFKEIAQKIYTTTPVDVQSVDDNVQISALDKLFNKYGNALTNTNNTIPNVKGMSGMDAISLLENIGLKVRFTGTGKVTYQSLSKGQKIKKGTTITLKLT